jgi:hypothetical protein
MFILLVGGFVTSVLMILGWFLWDISDAIILVGAFCLVIEIYLILNYDHTAFKAWAKEFGGRHTRDQNDEAFAQQFLQQNADRVTESAQALSIQLVSKDSQTVYESTHDLYLNGEPVGSLSNAQKQIVLHTNRVGNALMAQNKRNQRAYLCFDIAEGAASDVTLQIKADSLSIIEATP